MSEHNGRTVNRRRIYLTTAIPYVNGAPHIGHALELVQVDALARAWRALGHEVRTLTGTDDNALKNVRAAEAAGVPVADFVRAHGDEFVDLFGPALGRARRRDPHEQRSAPPTRRRAPVAGVRRRGATCTSGTTRARTASAVRRSSTPTSSTPAGRCPEHRAPPDVVRERNWFFRLSRYGDRIAHRDRERRAPHRACVASQRGARPTAIGAARHQRVEIDRACPRLGDPGARRPVAGRLRLVRRVWPTTSPRSGAGTTRHSGGTERTNGSISSARASSASTPSTGRRSWRRPACRFRPRCSCTTT